MSINQSHELYSGIAQLHQQLQRLQLRLRLRNVDIFHFAFKIIETFFIRHTLLQVIFQMKIQTLGDVFHRYFVVGYDRSPTEVLYVPENFR